MLYRLIYKICEVTRKGLNKLFIVPGLKSSLGFCGMNVRISYDCDMKSLSNISIGNSSQIGPHSLFWTTRAKIIIGNFVVFGPHVTIITGDHRTDLIGKHIKDVRDEEKLPEYDADVVIEDDVWIGCNVTILKGVTIGEGCVIAAGSVVTNSTEPYSIYGGIPAKKIKDRFSKQELEMHKNLLTSAISN